MKIKMKTTKCGPDPAENWKEGQVRNVCPEEARYWHEAGVCTLLEPYPAEAEKAVVKAPEKAVVAPVEKAVVGPAETAASKKQGVAIPAQPAVAAEWGKP